VAEPQEVQGLAEIALEAVRSAALGAAPDGIRTFVIASSDRDAIRGALEEDGLAIAIASDAKTLVGRANGTLPLGGAGPTALARAARAALADGAASVLFLDDAGASDEVTARFWWTLAVLLSQDDAPNGVLIAACSPRASDAWTAAAASVRGLVAVRELVRFDAVPSVRAAKAKRAKTPSPGGRHARRALFRATAALLRGAPRAVETAASAAVDAGAAADDAREAAAAELALALRAFPGERPEPFLRAVALAQLAGDDALAAAASIARRAAAWLRGDFADARRARGAATAKDLPRSVARALSDLGFADIERHNDDERDADAATLAARGEAHERAGRRAVAARLFACAAAAQGQPFRGATWQRAARLWESADPRLAAAMSAAASPGLGSATLPPGAAGIAEALRACATLATARDAAPGAALELACQLVPCRSATLVHADGRLLAARGAAALSLGRLHADGQSRGSAPQELAAGATIRVALARSADDPPFSRDERRLAAAIAELAAAILSSIAPAAIATVSAPAPAKPATKKKRPLEPLDDRLSEVERGVLVEALRRNGNNLSRTARTLGLSRNGLKMKLARHGLPRGTST